MSSNFAPICDLPTIEVHHCRQDVKAEAQIKLYLQAFLPQRNIPRFERTPRGRPFLVGEWSDVDCNWSHSGELLAVAFSQHHRVGIDIEQVRERDVARLADRFFLESESALLRDAHDFFELWVRKEALLKAIGQGLAHGLKRVQFGRDGERWQLEYVDPTLCAYADWNVGPVELPAGYVGAVAWRGQYTDAHEYD